MINLDMVGRLNETNNLQISGVGTATGLKDLIYSKSDTSVIKLTLSDEGYGPSDHSSFYGKNIPVLFYFTGRSYGLSHANRYLGKNKLQRHG